MNSLYALFVIPFGLVFGSFFNVVILRLPKKESLSTEGSHCVTCGHKLSPLDLVPVFSYLFLQGKCRYCKAEISPRYPLVEMITAIFYGLVVYQYGYSFQSLIGLIYVSILIIIAVMDIDTMEILDRFQLLILILALSNLFITNLSLYNHVIAFFMISVPFFLIAHFYGGMGGGDVKLVAVNGLLIGIQSTLVAFFIASITGGIVAIYLLSTKQKEKSSAIAFGPYLCLGFAIAYIWGEGLFTVYLSLFS